MASEVVDLECLKGQFAKLERENARLKKAGLLALSIIGVVFLMGQAGPKRRIVEAERFVLRDAQGKMRAQIFVEGALSRIGLYDEDEKLGAALTVSSLGSSLSLTNQLGTELQANAIGTGGNLILSESKERMRFILSATSPNDPANLLLFGSGKASAFLQAETEASLLEISDRDGFKTIVGSTELEVARTGETRRTSAASVIMFDKEGRVLWRAP